MTFLDIVFQVNLGPLTYRCPEELSDIAEPGMIVSAPLKNKIAKGIITGRSLPRTTESHGFTPVVRGLSVPAGEIKNILTINGETPVLNRQMIELLRWMADYYLSTQGLVLKNMLPKEVFLRVKSRKSKEKSPALKRGNLIDIPDSEFTDIRHSINRHTYRGFLLHAPSSIYEYSFVIKILEEAKNAIILLPEVTQINNLYPFLKESFGERVCLFHSGLSKGKRSETIERILSGQSDIILGTRSAIFAPFKRVSFIAVLHEHSGSYKQEDGLRYSGRDVAVMRGYLEKATVLLSSICPSIESLYNCKSGKYTLLKPVADIKKLRVRIIDMKYEKLFKPYLSKTVVDAAVRRIKNNKKVVFVINRRGYSTLLQCRECNYIEECHRCKIPMILHKQDRSLKCHYCGHSSTIPENCHRCKSYNIELLGAGTQRVQEDIEKLLKGTTSGIIRFDSDIARKKSEVKRLIETIHKDDVRIIIGTKLMTKRISISEGFSMAVILDTDLFLNIPDFRSAEKAYQEISSLMDMVEPNGDIFLQTRIPQNYLFKCLKNQDYKSFFEEEIKRRKALLYPPYSKLLFIKFISKRDLSKKLSETIRTDKDIEILGPLISKNTKGQQEFSVLLKSSVRGKLHSTAKTLISVFEGSKDVRIRIDVDPLVTK
ncbi:MAG: primosomal protein N' [Nitrospirae bacterium]|nr:primosomal protein N' [Nitrospirota bacterium]